MKFSIADPADGYTIQAYTRTEIVVGGQRFNRCLILLPDRIIRDWGPASCEQVTAADFELILDMSPDLVLLGTGEHQRFPSTDVYRAMSAAQLGLEVMTTPAACRTYNILAAEGRKVAAALLLDT